MLLLNHSFCAELAWSAGEPAAWRRLRHLLQPIMWRNTKAAVASDLQLPSSSVQVSRPSLLSPGLGLADHLRSARPACNTALHRFRRQLSKPSQTVFDLRQAGIAITSISDAHSAGTRKLPD